jgi:hypothetical protein
MAALHYTEDREPHTGNDFLEKLVTLGAGHVNIFCLLQQKYQA